MQGKELPPPQELMFKVLVQCIKAGQTKGIKWKNAAKAILWADERISKLEQQSAGPESGDVKKDQPEVKDG